MASDFAYITTKEVSFKTEGEERQKLEVYSTSPYVITFPNGLPTGITWDESTEELVSDGTQTDNYVNDVQVKLIGNTFEVEQTIRVNVYLNQVRSTK